MSMDYIHPFSSGKAVANFIKNNDLINIPIIGDHYVFTSVISGYLDVPIYYSDRQEFATFWTSEPKSVSDKEQLLQGIEAQINTSSNQNLILIFSSPRYIKDIHSRIKEIRIKLKDKGIATENLANFDKSLIPYQNFYLYLARKNDST